jgi:Domain of unknown function (DUF4440)
MRVISAVLILISVTGSGWIRTGDVLAAVPDASQRERLLKVREDGWRAFFANDQARMKAIFPADTIAINAGQADWDGQKETLVAAEQFVSQHGKLVSLQFPRTEIQIFGDVAVLYSVYRLETESTESGLCSRAARRRSSTSATGSGLTRAGTLIREHRTPAVVLERRVLVSWRCWRLKESHEAGGWQVRDEEALFRSRGASKGFGG